MKHLVNRLLTVFASGLLLASCSTDDYEPSYDNSELWQGELAAAPYAKDAVCLVPTGAEFAGKTVSFIELSPSGQYFITYMGNGSYSRPQSFRKLKTETRDWLPYESVTSGFFTVLGENRYELDGFGVMTINSDGTVNLTLTEGDTYVWPVTKVDKIDNTPLNTRLCRSWDLIDGYIDFLDEKMNKVYSLEIPLSVMEEDYIYAISFTFAGRVYRKDYPEDGWYGGSWRWSDAASQIVECHSDDPSNGEGMFQAIFNNNRMLVMNPWMFEDGEEARWEFTNIPGYDNIPYNVRYAREYINLEAMN